MWKWSSDFTLLLWRVKWKSICDETQTNVCFWNAFLLVLDETTHSFIFIAFCGLWAIYFNLFWNIVQFYSAVDFIIFIFFLWEFYSGRTNPSAWLFVFQIYCCDEILFINKFFFIWMWTCMPHLCAHHFPFFSLCCSLLWLLDDEGHDDVAASNIIIIIIITNRWLTVKLDHCRNVHLNES